ncbi:MULTISPECIES: hypothetical protein [unclassified Rhizobium]|uniref:hypothetical protein n=1 Tax=unclassified Rhizobium TaxID=2613769 RepID=UPI00138F3129|nr:MULTISPECIES: hypothetical protein [unclassified Rhizobium]
MSKMRIRLIRADVLASIIKDDILCLGCCLPQEQPIQPEQILACDLKDRADRPEKYGDAAKK